MTENSIEKVSYVIVGGGISGLLVANLLKQKGLSFIGLEKAEVLGGRSVVGHHRVYTEGTINLFKRLIPELKWNTIEEAVQIRKKGEWDTPEAHSDVPQDEMFYLGHKFHSPDLTNAELIKLLAANVEESYRLRQAVLSVAPGERVLECMDGSRIEFEKLIWCTSLFLLNKIWKGDRAALQKIMKKGSAARGGIDLEWELSEEIIPMGNTVIFPFRFKDHKLRALGVQEKLSSGKLLFHLMLFLEEEISEDREEVAKCLKALRREFEKDFPESRSKVLSEKIVYLPEVSGETASRAKGLEIQSGIFYVGPQVQVGEDEATLHNWDLIANNCAALETAISAGNG